MGREWGGSPIRPTPPASLAGTPPLGFVESIELFDHEAATTCATPMLLQFRRAFVLDCRTKFEGKRKIKEEILLEPKKELAVVAEEKVRR